MLCISYITKDIKIQIASIDFFLKSDSRRISQFLSISFRNINLINLINLNLINLIRGHTTSEKLQTDWLTRKARKFYISFIFFSTHSA